MITLEVTMGEWLRIMRLRLGISTDEMAKELGITRQTVLNIENEKTKRKYMLIAYKTIVEERLKKE